MRFKKQFNFVTEPELSSMSKTKTLFVDGNSSSREILSKKDSIVTGDIVGLSSFLLAKGHTRRLYQLISDVQTRSIGG